MCVCVGVELPAHSAGGATGYLCQLVPASFSFSVFGSFIQPLVYLMRRGEFPTRAKQ